MSLYELADGILKTHVTWQDVEEELQKTLRTNAKFGEHKKATDIGDQKGFMSKIALVEPDWIGVEEGEQLPQKFIVKIASQIPLLALSKAVNDVGDEAEKKEKMNKIAQYTKDCHNTEVEAYKLLGLFNHPDVPYTKIYGAKSFVDEHDMKGFIVAEFVTDMDDSSPFCVMTPDDAAGVFKAIATFSALEYKHSEKNKGALKTVEVYLEVLFKEFVGEDSLKNQLDKLNAQLKEVDEQQAEKLIKTYWHYFNLLPKYSKMSELLGAKLVLNHGDLWQTNLLYCKNEDGTRKLRAIIDWQGCSKVHLGLDLSRLLLGCLSNEDRRNHYMDLLTLYHETFTSTLGRELFTFEELLDSYNLYFPMMSMMIEPQMMPFLEAAELPEEQKEFVKKMTFMKSVGMMEDVLKVHDENVLKFPDFMKQ